MEVQDPRIRSLLRHADRVAESGKRAAAAGLYRQIIEEAPETVPAWLGLAQTVANVAEQEAAYQQVLALEPENEIALTALRPSGTPPSEQEEETTDGRVHWDDLAASMAWASEALAGGEKGAKKATRLESDDLELPDKAKVDEQVAADDPLTLAPGQPGGVEVAYCANHARVATSLRCNRCGKPICSRCAKLTPVGYRCPQCIREREDVFYSATPADYIIAGIVALVLGGILGTIVPWIGFFALFVAPVAGGMTGTIILRLIGRRRGRWLPLLAVIIFVIAALPAAIIYLTSAAFFGIGFYFLLAPGALYYALK